MLASKVIFQGQEVNEKIYGLGEHRTGKVNQYKHSSYNKPHLKIVGSLWDLSIDQAPLLPQVNQMPFFKDFAESTVYGRSHGADAMIPWWGFIPIPGYIS